MLSVVYRPGAGPAGGEGDLGLFGFVWVCLGSFWLWVPLRGEKWGWDWVCLGLFGFAFAGENLAFFA